MKVDVSPSTRKQRRKRQKQLRRFLNLLKPGPAKQAWKQKGNYFTPEELAEMDKVDDPHIAEYIEPSMDAN